MAIAVGTLLGPYEVLAPLGAGGMGEVWRARDARVDRQVALKILPGDFLEGEEGKDRRERFEREARLLASLNHPNIAVLYSFEEIPGSSGAPSRHVIVMELLEGETLRDALRAGPLPVRKALDLGSQIADGLAAAHEKGIVHRDLKPENVFVTRGGHVKLLDFGLARHEAIPAEVGTRSLTAVRQTEAGAVMGTVGYLSPEQIHGGPVDHRSDIFAFGCVLHEMLSGIRAFRRPTTPETLTAILREDPPPLPLSGGEIGPALQSIVRRCLEKRPDDRFSSAHDLSLALQALSSAEGSLAVLSPRAPIRRATRRAAVLAVAALALVAIGAALLWRARPEKRPALDPKRVAVLPFENKTGDASGAAAALLVADRITTGLSRVGGISVATDAGSSSGAGLVIAGAVHATGAEVELQARLVSRADGRVIYAVEPARGPLSNLDPAIEVVRQRVLGAVATHVEGWHVDPSVMRPPTFEAYQELVRAREIYNRDFEATIRHAERMVELDPRSSFGYFALSMFRMNKGAFAEAQKPLAEVERLRGEMTEFERLNLSYMTTLLAGRLPESLASIRRMNELAPKLEWVRHSRSTCEIQLNLPRATLRTLEAPLYERWGGVGAAEPFRIRTNARHMLGEYDGQLSGAREGRARFPGDLRFAAEEAAALSALGRIAEVERTVEGALTVTASIGSIGRLMLVTVDELRAHGQPAAASKMLARAVEWYRGRPAAEAATEGNRAGLGQALLRAGRLDEAATLFGDLVREKPDEVFYEGRLGVLAALRGDRAEAERISEELRRIDRPYLFGEHHFERARIASRLGEKEQAVALLRQAFSEGYRFGVYVHRDPDLEPLRGYSPFEELVQPKG